MSSQEISSSIFFPETGGATLLPGLLFHYQSLERVVTKTLPTPVTPGFPFYRSTLAPVLGVHVTWVKLSALKLNLSLFQN